MDMMNPKLVRSILLDMGRNVEQVTKQLRMSALRGVQREEPRECPVAKYLTLVTGRKFSVVGSTLQECQTVKETWTNPYTGVSGVRDVERRSEDIRVPRPVQAFINRYDAKKITL